MGEWTIDELAREAGTTVRNIRVYQDRGLLDPPARRGRVGIYGKDHLDRLLLILRLLERGYPMAAIAELLDAWRGRQGLGVILGLDDAVHRAFVDEEPERLSADELARMFPAEDGNVVAQAVEAGIVEADGDAFITRTPGLVRAGAQLVADGMPVDVVMEAGAAIMNATDDLARLMVDAAVSLIWEPFKAAGMPAEDWPRILRALENGRDSALTGVMSALGGALRRATEAAIAEIGEPLELARNQPAATRRETG
jgi:DNA-binding transcriptional MerR regulator